MRTGSKEDRDRQQRVSQNNYSLNLKAIALALTCAVLLAGCASTVISTSESPAKRNVILFLGDGMGISTVTAARIYAGQQRGGTGEEYVLPFETFPNVALVKTYTTDRQVPDSAGTMTAIMTGEKTRSGYISVAADVERDDCAASLARTLPTLLEQAEDRGFATGIVTTAKITHATPAATFAHTPNRNWESNENLPASAVAQGCRDIARQLAEFDRGNGIEVALGGGRAEFYPVSQNDPEYPDQQGDRTDDANMVERWQSRGSANGLARTYVWNLAQFNQLAIDDTQVLGLFERSHMQFDRARSSAPAGEPSLADMTAFAIRKLERTDQGFFLMVEGGRIDHGHHYGNAYRALTDSTAFADAVAVAMEMTSETNTLILVTADHSHTMTLSGYPRRGNPILGKVETTPGVTAKDLAGRPYTIIAYANGGGYQAEIQDLTDVDTEAPSYRQAAAVPMASETHAGEDVAAYARGPNADSLRGVVEQDALYAILRDALFSSENADGY